MSVTVEQHTEKLFKFLCAYGKLGKILNRNLKSGSWCVDQEDELLELKYLLDIFSNYDTRDLPAMTNDYNCITGDQYLQLICQIESKL